MLNQCLEIRWKLLIFASLISPSKIVLYQAFDTVFHLGDLKVCQKYFITALGVSSGDKTLRLMLDILR